MTGTQPPWEPWGVVMRSQRRVINSFDNVEDAYDYMNMLDDSWNSQLDPDDSARESFGLAYVHLTPEFACTVIPENVAKAITEADDLWERDGFTYYDFAQDRYFTLVACEWVALDWFTPHTSRWGTGVRTDLQPWTYVIELV